MDDKEKQDYLEKYQEAKKKGVPFFPDIIFKDVVVSLVIFLILVAMAYFLGTPLESRADPGDTSYTPKPEWYFLFLFQLLKYFPGQLEVIGVIVIPSLFIIILFILPLLDQSNRRHFFRRPWITALTTLSAISFIFLTIQAVTEAPPPAEAAEGDRTAVLYTQNCAPCHGSSIIVPVGTNLHGVIAQGKHEGMPAWSADLTTDQIDALAGFVLSPGGSRLFADNCSACHEAPELVSGDPLELRNALDQGSAFPAHAEVELPDWGELMTAGERTALLNFLVAPDGQRLFQVNCAPCHGRSVAFSGEETELREIIAQGGLHLQMPPWQEKLSDSELDTLASYTVDPASVPNGSDLFTQYCAACHGERVPAAPDYDLAREIIASGGSHETMPIWGDLLTTEQLDALVSYTFQAARGTPLEVGQELFVINCGLCHGEFGEGGLNPARSDDIIAPISSAEYLKTRDDFTLRAIIAQGQPNFGMSPFGSAYGGPLDDDQVDAIVAYMRSWEANPPVELPPEVASTPISQTGREVYFEVCAQCHGPDGEGLIGPSLSDPAFQERNTDQDIFNIINLGHEATAMIAWGEILSGNQIQQLVEFIRQFGETETVTKPEPTPKAQPTPTTQPEPSVEGPSFADDVFPIFEAKCIVCHGVLGGWDGTTYEATVNTGDHAPVVIPGDPEGSLLGQKILGTHTEGAIMPPAGKMSDDEIQTILDWIAAGALDN